MGEFLICSKLKYFVTKFFQIFSTAFSKELQVVQPVKVFFFLKFSKQISLHLETFKILSRSVFFLLEKEATCQVNDGLMRLMSTVELVRTGLLVSFCGT